MEYFSEGRALIIGVGQYEAQGWSVPVTASDAKGVVDALTDPDIGAYPPGQIDFLHDTTATLEGIRQAFQRLQKAAEPTNTVFIYFCGHGVLGDDGKYYLTARDTQFTPTDLVRSGTGLSAEELHTLLEEVKAKKVLLIVNACLSNRIGGALGGPGATSPLRGAPPSTQFKAVLLGSGEGRCFLAASRASEESYFTADDNTFFGQALLDGLQDKDGKVAGQSGFIGLYELYTYVHKQVKKQSNGRQEPVLTMDQVVGPFAVALRPSAAGGPRGLGAPTPIQQALPADVPVERLPSTTISGIQQAAQKIIVHGNQITAPLIDLRWQTNSGTQNFSLGNMTNITLSLSAASASQVSARDQLPGLIDQSLADLAKLADAPAAQETKGDREDACYALTQAKEAVVGGDIDRARRKLEEAATLLAGLSERIVAALPISQAVSALLARAPALSGTGN